MICTWIHVSAPSGGRVAVLTNCTRVLVPFDIGWTVSSRPEWPRSLEDSLTRPCLATAGGLRTDLRRSRST